MLGVISLDKHPAFRLAAPSPAGYLGQKLKCPLGRSKIRQTEAKIDRNNADQRDVRKIVSFGDHLSADEHIKFSSAEIRKNILHITPTGDRISVYTRYSQLRKAPSQLVFELFRTFTDKIQIFAGTNRAAVGRIDLIIAIMTDQLSLAAMVGQCDIAIPTFNCLAAGSTEHKLRKSATIEQNHRLFAVLVSFFDRVEQPRRKRDVLSAGLAKNLAHIDDLRHRKLSFRNSSRKVKIFVFTFLSVEICLERGGCRPENDYRIGEACPHYGDIPGVIERRFVLTV